MYAFTHRRVLALSLIGCIYCLPFLLGSLQQTEPYINALATRGAQNAISMGEKITEDVYIRNTLHMEMK